jgi:HlyD family secretion protein
VAQLNPDRSVIHASVNGKISNMDLRPGTYVTAGKGVMALVDTDTLHVDGYFEETKLPHIQIGDRVAIRLMGNATPLTGHVESIAAGIEDRDRAQGANLLADVNPTFNWVRLAQRVPVRVSLDDIPADGTLVAGRTATVEVLSQKSIGLAWLFRSRRRPDVLAQQSEPSALFDAPPAASALMRWTERSEEEGPFSASNQMTASGARRSFAMTLAHDPANAARLGLCCRRCFDQLHGGSDLGNPIEP